MMTAKAANDKTKMLDNLNEAIKVYQNTLKLAPNDPNILAGLMILSSLLEGHKKRWIHTKPRL